MAASAHSVRQLKYVLNELLASTAGASLAKKMRPFRGKHQGQRCFLVGNGPSIQHQDLSLLKDEFVFATNRLVLHPQYDEIQPKYYCFSDAHFMKKPDGREIVQAILDKPFSTQMFVPVRWYFSSAFKKMQVPRVNYIPFRYNREIWRLGTASLDPEKGYYLGQTVIVDFALPLAYYLGFSKVYLLGCDLDYSGTSGTTHFYGTREETKRRAGNIYSRKEWYDQASASYEVIRELFRKENVEVFDATLKGNLTVFPKVEYNSLFGKA